MKKSVITIITGIFILILTYGVWAQNYNAVPLERHYLPDDLIEMGMKQYPGSNHVSTIVDKTSGDLITTFTTTDSAEAVINFYKENMKNLEKYGYKQVDTKTTVLKDKGIDPTAKDTLVYMKDSIPLQIQVVQHKNLPNINKIVIRKGNNR